jgi:lipid-binding SYLF domain-containing protein
LSIEGSEHYESIHGATTAYYSIASTSVGLTAGMATHSEIVMFMTQATLDIFFKSRGWSIGADAGIAVVSKGRAGTSKAIP